MIVTTNYGEQFATVTAFEHSRELDRILNFKFRINESLSTCAEQPLAIKDLPQLPVLDPNEFPNCRDPQLSIRSTLKLWNEPKSSHESRNRITRPPCPTRPKPFEILE